MTIDHYLQVLNISAPLYTQGRSRSAYTPVLTFVAVLLYYN